VVANLRRATAAVHPAAPPLTGLRFTLPD
jgi:hypothetical protein